MGLLDLSLKEGFDSLQQRLTAPFDRFFAPELDMKGALARNDFPNGVELLEYQEGRPLPSERIILIGDYMIQQPFKFGGTQKLVKDYYPGNSEPTVQVLGPRESDITIKGRIKSKKLKKNPPNQIGPQQFPDEEIRRFAENLQLLMDAMRIRGNVVRFTMGEFQRFGFIEETKFSMKTLADIDYEISLSIIGFNPPSDCKVLGRARTVPFDINKNLINRVNEFQSEFSVIPDAIPRSFADQLNDAISDIAGAINLVTGFVDGVLNEVDSLKASVARAEGLIKNAKAFISSTQRRVGAFDPLGEANIGSGGGISSGYSSASYLTSFLSFTFSLTALLASLQTQLSAIAENEPLARHKVQSGDTLQRLAQKFYNDQSQWSEIYDHNRLTDTELTIGAILEIPRIDGESPA